MLGCAFDNNDHVFVLLCLLSLCIWLYQTGEEHKGQRKETLIQEHIYGANEIKYKIHGFHENKYIYKNQLSTNMIHISSCHIF